MFTDLDEAALWQYRSAAQEPDDLDAFWLRTLSESGEYPLDVTLSPVDAGLESVDVWDVTFAGFGGHVIAAWLLLPTNNEERLPAVVQYLGYGGGRGNPLDHLLWPTAGYATLVMDTRGQGSGHSAGVTPDPVGSGPSFPGHLTRGIDHPDNYYYRRVYVDAVSAVDVLRAHPRVDSSQLFATGGSQGGGIAIAVAALRRDLTAIAAHVPFLCDLRRASVLTDNPPYQELGRYLAVHRTDADRVFHTLSYFDGVNLARRAQAHALFSAALMDATCPPSTVFGAFHNYGGPKSITVWPYNGHEGGGVEDRAEALRMFNRLRVATPERWPRE